MARTKNTIAHIDLLLKCMAEPDPMLSMLERLRTQLMEAEVSGLAEAEKNAHSPSRSDYRCGYRPRQMDARMGTMYLISQSCVEEATFRSLSRSANAAKWRSFR